MDTKTSPPQFTNCTSISWKKKKKRRRWDKKINRKEIKTSSHDGVARSFLYVLGPVTRVPHTAVAPFLDQLPKCVAFCTIIKRSCGGGSRSSSPFREEEENKKIEKIKF